MKFGGLITATVILAALAGGLYFSNRKEAEKAAKPTPDTTAHVLSIKPSDIQQIEIKHKDGEDTVIQRSDANKWKMTAPGSYGVDQETASALLSAASNVSADRVIDEKAADLAGYGLNAPRLEVDLTTKDGKAKKLLMGDDSPTGNSTYAMLAGEPKVYTVASGVRSSLDKSAKDLRDKRLLTFEQDKVSRLELQAKKQDIEFGRDKDQWQILKPKSLRADGLQVEELLRKLKDVKMDLGTSADDAKKAAAAFASGTPVATAKVTDASGTQELQVRKSKDDYYAKSSAVEGAYKVAADLGTSLDKGLDDFRNKKVLDFGFSDPNKIELHANGKTYTITQSGQDWMENGKKMDNISVQNLIDKLRELSATAFVDRGFGTPSVDLSVTSNGGKRTEKVLFSKKDDKTYVAQRENESSLYEVDAKSVDDIVRAAGDVKPSPATAGK